MRLLDSSSPITIEGRENRWLQFTIRRALWAIFWIGACLAALRIWWFSPDDFMFLVFAAIAFCMSIGGWFRNTALGALVGFLLATAGLIAANVIAMIRLFA